MKLTDLLNEQTIGYTPERIDTFIQDARIFYEKGKKYYQKKYNSIIVLSIQDCMTDYNKLMDELNKMKNNTKVVESTFDKYYTIVDSFGVGDYPDNVVELDKLSTMLDNLTMDLKNVDEALESLLESAKYLLRNGS